MNQKCADITENLTDDEFDDEIGIYDCPCSFVYSPGTEECDWCHYDRKCGH